MGIVGYTYKSGELQNIASSYSHEFFNRKIDLDTAMPVLYIPLKNEYSKKIIGILTIVNSKGI